MCSLIISIKFELAVIPVIFLFCFGGHSRVLSLSCVRDEILSNAEWYDPTQIGTILNQQP